MSIHAPVLTQAMAGLAAAGWLLGSQAAFADPGRWHVTFGDSDMDR